MQVFCVEHRSCKSRDCPKSDHNSREAVVCETCSITCKTCQIKVCLKHRFPADHACKLKSSSSIAGVKKANMFLADLASRNDINE
ncbi:hypothetical protein RJ640_007917, partial [Escallonia rubra]